MCGIAGIVSKRAPLVSGRIEEMIARLRHRGPNDEGFHRTAFAHSGMARLSILDLVSDGLCPIVSPDGQQVLVFNGEIYNFIEVRADLMALGHRFRSTSDSEVLLTAYAQWGIDCLDHFNGMFAFAIADYRNDLLFLARDRAGEKPLFYYEDTEQFIFASEIKAILTQIDLPDPNITPEFLALEYVAGNETLFQGIHCVEAGTYLVYRGLRGKPLGSKVASYWKVGDHLREVDPAKAVDILDELLQDSVRLRLRSDVPWGLYLSGGLDSSLLACMARPSICFSVHFPYGPRYDELEYATFIAKHIGAQQVVVEPTAADFAAFLPDCMYHLEMPVGSFSIFPLFMLAREASRHVRIVLSGEGADELFSGYSRYLILAHEQELERHPEMATYQPLLNYYYGPAVDRYARLLNRGGPQQTEVVKRLVAPYFAQMPDLLNAMGYAEFKLMLVTLLQMEDRSAAAFGIENRSPYLDHRIIEFAYSLPGDLKIRDMTSKWILRQVATRHLPEKALARRPKMGLVAPINQWLGYGGRRGEFDRQAYTDLCMKEWRNVFFEQPRWQRS